MGVAPGIYPHGAGWRAVVSQGRGRAPVQKHFPKETPLRVMQAWREDMRAACRVQRKQRATSGTFEHDARRYLEAVKGLSTYQTRRVDIQRWINIFGTRQRDTITSVNIRIWRDRWMTEPRSEHPSPRVKGIARPNTRRSANPLASTPHAASTINHWLRALSNLWTVLDGRRAQNPVREVPEVPEPDARPRGVPYALVEQIIDAIPDRGQPPPRTGHTRRKRPTYSLTKLRLRVLAYTGLTYSQLARLTKADVNFEQGHAFAVRRQKGKGSSPRLLPLVPEAIEALRALDAANGWGAFSTGSVRKTFLLAVDKVRAQGVDVPHGIRPYDLRHGFGGLVFRATHSLRAVQQLLMHENPRTTHRYALGEVDAVLRAQLDQVKIPAKLSSQPVND